MDRRTRRWHNRVSQIILYLEDLTFTPASFSEAIGEIRRCTDKYLSQGENLSVTDQDRQLRGLITEHPSQTQAVLACAHALSPSALQDLVKAIGADAQKEEEFSALMNLILAVHELNETAIPISEVKWVNCLKELLSTYPDGAEERFQLYDGLVTQQSIPTLLSPRIVRSILQISIKRLGLCFEQWKEANEWTKAYRNSRWMRQVSGSLSHLKSILDDNICDWKSWASWEPNLHYFQRLEELNPTQRRELQDIFALEGPDFNSSPPKAKLLAALGSWSIQKGLSELQCGNLHLRWKNGDLGLIGLVDSLLEKTVQVCKASERAGTIISYIVQNGFIDEVTLGSFTALETGDPSIISGTIDAINSDTREKRLPAVMKIIPALKSSQIESLRSCLSPIIRCTLRESVSALQDRFNENLQQGKSLRNVGRKLYRIGSLVQENQWLQSQLDFDVWSLLSSYPPHDNMEALLELREESTNDTTATGDAFSLLLDQYCLFIFTGRGDLGLGGQIVIQELLEFWQKEFTLARRSIATYVAQLVSIPGGTRCRLFEDINRMTEDFCEIVLDSVLNRKEQGCVDFARALSSYRKIGQGERYRWQAVLESKMSTLSSTLLNYTATNLGISQWFQWHRDIRFLSSSQTNFLRDFKPTLCDWTALCEWVVELEYAYLEALTALEKIISRDSLRTILLVPDQRELVILFLDMVEQCTKEGCVLRPIYDKIMTMLLPDLSNLPQLGVLIRHLFQSSDHGKNFCLRLLETWRTLPSKTCKGMFQVCLGQIRSAISDPFDLCEATLHDLESIRQLGILLDLNSTTADDLGHCLDAACDHLDERFEGLVVEACRLQSLRRALMAHNREETMELLASIGISDFDDGIVEIPESLVDVIEQHGYQEFEIIFPLSNLKPLQRVAMGVGAADNIMVRLNLEGDFESSPQFCVHMNPEVDINAPQSKSNDSAGWVGEHCYWRASSGSEPLDLNFCTGRGNRTTYLVSMTLWRHFSTTGFESLESVHQIVSSAIKNYGHNCLICGDRLNAKVFRATTCHQSSCKTQFCKADYEVQLADLRWDPAVIDLLLLGVFAAAQSYRYEFLDPCPLQAKAVILQTMAGLPDPHSLQGAPNMNNSVKGLGPNEEDLLLWMGSYRGFIASATGLLMVPNLPGVHQFVLAGAPPELEANFVSHLPSPQSPSQVVFHGTTMDRLFPILRQGLQVGTGTALVQHGAAYGAGIYCATDIGTSFGFAGGSCGWPNSRLSNTKVIFGCELAGRHNLVGGIYVVTNPTQIRIRYIFLFPSTATTPPATHHIVPAMQSAFSLLRSGQI